MTGLEGTLEVQLDLKKDDFMCFGAWLWEVREILRAVGGILLLGTVYMGSEISEANYFK